MMKKQLVQTTMILILATMWMAVSGQGNEKDWSAWADTKGGTDGKVIRVTNLKSEGPGSLRAALEAQGKRLVVFDVAGVIDMELKTVIIDHPFVTVAGQTAPSPGITIVRGGIFIRTHDVIIQHLRVRPGDGGKPTKIKWRPDAIGTGTDREDPDASGASNVLIDHCSLTWAVDENLSASGPRDQGPERTSNNITFSNNIIAECLHHSNHHSPHSKGSLIHDFCKKIAVVGNLYAHNNDRNPWFKGHTTGVIVNNVIYNPGKIAIRGQYVSKEYKNHKYNPKPCRISVVGNVLFHGPDTRSDLPLIKGSNAIAYLDDNLAFDREGEKAAIGNVSRRLEKKSVWPEGLQALPADRVTEHVARNAGARPWDRDETDRRIIRSFKERTGQIIDSQEEVGGYPKHRKVKRVLEVPSGNRRKWLEELGKNGKAH